MSEKLRIRKKRQSLMEKQGPATPRAVDREADPLLVEKVEERMAKTNMDFYSTASTFYQRGGTAQLPSREVMSKEISTRLKNKSSRPTNSPDKKSREVSPVFRTLSPGKQTRMGSRR